MSPAPSNTDLPSTRPAARVAVLLPCLNEEATIGSVVSQFRVALPGASVYVCDNGSDDLTAEAARRAGAEVIVEERRGKGRAVRRLFREVDADVYLIADGDGTYDAGSAERLVATLAGRYLDMVVAVRRSTEPGAYTTVRRFGNRLFSLLAWWRCHRTVRDLLSGYRAFSRRYVDAFPARSDGFEVETEMTLFAASAGMAWDEIECPYFARPQGSRSKLHAFRDGLRILRTLFWTPAAAAGERRLGGLRAAVLVAAVTVVATAFFLALNWLAVSGDPEPVADALRASLEHPARTLEDSAERFNDCLLSLMTLDRGGTRVERTVSPRRVYRYTRPQRPCDALEQRLSQGAVDDSDYLTVFYHQYWAGQRVMLQWLLPPLGVDGLRRTLRVLTFGLLGLGFFAAAARAVLLFIRGEPESDSHEGTGDSKRWRENLFQALALAALFLCLFLFLDLDRRAGSFTTGASNVLTLALLIAVPVLGIANWKPGPQILLFAGFGAAIAYHELLFGSALIGLACVLLALATAPPPAQATVAVARDWWRALYLRCGGAYVSCLSAVFLLRVVIAEFVFQEPVLFKFWDQLTHRLYGAPRSSIHPEIDPFYASRPTVERFLQRVGDNLGTVGFGSTAVAVVLLGGAALTLIAATLFVLSKRRSLEEPWRWLGILAAGWCVPAWFVVFSAHTMAHVPVIVRLLALPYAAAAILIVGAVVFGRRSQAV
ncbi:MAG: glycosyltransferase [Acidobacteriota bacterium]|nr:glycosyltransferase [Acidobacteriota bacterium]MDE3266349.1 glycosyltransferase [Acidobacteriota bacterium]